MAANGLALYKESPIKSLSQVLDFSIVRRDGNLKFQKVVPKEGSNNLQHWLEVEYSKSKFVTHLAQKTLKSQLARRLSYECGSGGTYDHRTDGGGKVANGAAAARIPHSLVSRPIYARILKKKKACIPGPPLASFGL
ncbi:contactin-associated protein-like 4 [Sesbania bispinosa]|nr:contactin-associated protein-like 4 [Sesbania bispinosa]